MNLEKTYTHATAKNEYTIELIVDGQLHLQINEKYGLFYWKASFAQQTIIELTKKTGNELSFEDFWTLLIKAMEEKEIRCFIDVLSTQDLQNLKNKGKENNGSKSSASKSNKRYIILTYMINDTKYHYPLSLNVFNKEYEKSDLKDIYAALRLELETARASALNDTSKTEQSFSINYDKKGKNASKIKEVDQYRSENQILKAKLQRLEEQAEKKKANIQIQAAIERTKHLKENLENPNSDLVSWKNKVEDQQVNCTDLKKQLNSLHKKICSLLTSEKEMTAKKKGDQIEKELMHVRNNTKKNNNEIDKLKKQLETSKTRAREFQIKAKKLNSQKQALRKGGRRNPYSSAGSVRSYNSFNSSKKSYNSGISSNSKKSNYSYNSYRLR